MYGKLFFDHQVYTVYDFSFRIFGAICFLQNSVAGENFMDPIVLKTRKC